MIFQGSTKLIPILLEDELWSKILRNVSKLISKFNNKNGVWRSHPIPKIFYDVYAQLEAIQD